MPRKQSAEQDNDEFLARKKLSSSLSLFNLNNVTFSSDCSPLNSEGLDSCFRKIVSLIDNNALIKSLHNKKKHNYLLEDILKNDKKNFLVRNEVCEMNNFSTLFPYILCNGEHATIVRINETMILEITILYGVIKEINEDGTIQVYFTSSLGGNLQNRLLSTLSIKGLNGLVLTDGDSIKILGIIEHIIEGKSIKFTKIIYNLPLGVGSFQSEELWEEHPQNFVFGTINQKNKDKLQTGIENWIKTALLQNKVYSSEDEAVSEIKILVKKNKISFIERKKKKNVINNTPGLHLLTNLTLQLGNKIDVMLLLDDAGEQKIFSTYICNEMRLNWCRLLSGSIFLNEEKPLFELFINAILTVLHSLGRIVGVNCHYLMTKFLTEIISSGIVLGESGGKNSFKGIINLIVNDSSPISVIFFSTLIKNIFYFATKDCSGEFLSIFKTALSKLIFNLYAQFDSGADAFAKKYYPLMDMFLRIYYYEYCVSKPVIIEKKNKDASFLLKISNLELSSLFFINQKSYLTSLQRSNGSTNYFYRRRDYSNLFTSVEGDTAILLEWWDSLSNRVTSDRFSDSVPNVLAELQDLFRIEVSPFFLKYEKLFYSSYIEYVLDGGAATSPEGTEVYLYLWVSLLKERFELVSMMNAIVGSIDQSKNSDEYREVLASALLPYQVDASYEEEPSFLLCCSLLGEPSFTLVSHIELPKGRCPRGKFFSRVLPIIVKTSNSASFTFMVVAHYRCDSEQVNVAIHVLHDRDSLAQLVCVENLSKVFCGGADEVQNSKVTTILPCVDIFCNTDQGLIVEDGRDKNLLRLFAIKNLQSLMRTVVLNRGLKAGVEQSFLLGSPESSLLCTAVIQHTVPMATSLLFPHTTTPLDIMEALYGEAVCFLSSQCTESTSEYAVTCADCAPVLDAHALASSIQMSEEQLLAVQRILIGISAPVVVPGASGAGKSRALAVAAMAVTGCGGELVVGDKSSALSIQLISSESGSPVQGVVDTGIRKLQKAQRELETAASGSRSFEDVTACYQAVVNTQLELKQRAANFHATTWSAIDPSGQKCEQEITTTAMPALLLSAGGVLENEVKALSGGSVVSIRSLLDSCMTRSCSAPLVSCLYSQLTDSSHFILNNSFEPLKLILPLLKLFARTLDSDKAEIPIPVFLLSLCLPRAARAELRDEGTYHAKGVEETAQTLFLNTDLTVCSDDADSLIYGPTDGEELKLNSFEDDLFLDVLKVSVSSCESHFNHVSSSTDAMWFVRDQTLSLLGLEETLSLTGVNDPRHPVRPVSLFEITADARRRQRLATEIRSTLLPILVAQCTTLIYEAMSERSLFGSCPWSEEVMTACAFFLPALLKHCHGDDLNMVVTATGSTLLSRQSRDAHAPVMRRRLRQVHKDVALSLLRHRILTTESSRQTVKVGSEGVLLGHAQSACLVLDEDTLGARSCSVSTLLAVYSTLLSDIAVLETPLRLAPGRGGVCTALCPVNQSQGRSVKSLVIFCDDANTLSACDTLLLPSTTVIASTGYDHTAVLASKAHFEVLSRHLGPFKSIFLSGGAQEVLSTTSGIAIETTNQLLAAIYAQMRKNHKGEPRLSQFWLCCLLDSYASGRKRVKLQHMCDLKFPVDSVLEIFGLSLLFPSTSDATSSDLSSPQSYFSCVLNRRIQRSQSSSIAALTAAAFAEESDVPPVVTQEALAQIPTFKSARGTAELEGRLGEARLQRPALRELLHRNRASEKGTIAASSTTEKASAAEVATSTTNTISNFLFTKMFKQEDSSVVSLRDAPDPAECGVPFGFQLWTPAVSFAAFSEGSQRGVCREKVAKYTLTGSCTIFSALADFFGFSPTNDRAALPVLLEHILRARRSRRRAARCGAEDDIVYFGGASGNIIVFRLLSAAAPHSFFSDVLEITVATSRRLLGATAIVAIADMQDCSPSEAAEMLKKCASVATAAVIAVLPLPVLSEQQKRSIDLTQGHSQTLANHLSSLVIRIYAYVAGVGSAVTAVPQALEWVIEGIRVAQEARTSSSASSSQLDVFTSPFGSGLRLCPFLELCCPRHAHKTKYLLRASSDSTASPQLFFSPFSLTHINFSVVAHEGIKMESPYSARPGIGLHGFLSTAARCPLVCLRRFHPPPAASGAERHVCLRLCHDMDDIQDGDACAGGSGYAELTDEFLGAAEHSVCPYLRLEQAADANGASCGHTAAVVCSAGATSAPLCTVRVIKARPCGQPVIVGLDSSGGKASWTVCPHVLEDTCGSPLPADSSTCTELVSVCCNQCGREVHNLIRCAELPFLPQGEPSPEFASQAFLAGALNAVYLGGLNNDSRCPTCREIYRLCGGNAEECSRRLTIECRRSALLVHLRARNSASAGLAKILEAWIIEMRQKPASSTAAGTGASEQTPLKTPGGNMHSSITILSQGETSGVSARNEVFEAAGAYIVYWLTRKRALHAQYVQAAEQTRAKWPAVLRERIQSQAKAVGRAEKTVLGIHASAEARKTAFTADILETARALTAALSTNVVEQDKGRSHQK